jgi:hypothetical protein
MEIKCIPTYDDVFILRLQDRRSSYKCWQVRWGERDGNKWLKGFSSKSFSDIKCGNEEASLLAAISYASDLIGGSYIYPKPTIEYYKEIDSRNTSGRIGVYPIKQDDRIIYYAAAYGGGKSNRLNVKCFPCRKYGDEKAFAMAVEFRSRWERMSSKGESNRFIVFVRDIYAEITSAS